MIRRQLTDLNVALLQEPLKKAEIDRVKECPVRKRVMFLAMALPVLWTRVFYLVSQNGRSTVPAGFYAFR